MKNISVILLLINLAVAGPVSFYGEFKADGALLKGAKTGKAVQVKGVSFFWSQWSGGFYNENAVNRIAQDWKAEVVRAAYGATGYAFENSTAAENRDRVETIIEASLANDIYVIIDWHSHSAHNADETERAKQFFAYFAQKYGHLDNVIFELYNEPTGAEWADIKSYAESVIPEIRKYSDNLILVGTPNYDQRIETVIGSAIEDPNLGYVLHFYAASHSLGTFRSNIISVQGAGLPLFVTEFGTTNADGGNPDEGHYESHSKANTDEWLKFLDSRKISYCAWSLFDKYEGSAFFGTGNSFDQTVPENWINSSMMTASGAYIFDMLQTNYETASWNENASPIANRVTAANHELQNEFEVYSLNGKFLGKMPSLKSLKAGAYIVKTKSGFTSVLSQP